MKHYHLIFLTVLLFESCSSQTETEITTEIGYIPEQRAEVSDEAYRKWTSALKNTYDQISEDSGKLVYADHINIASALMKLKEPKQKVLDQWFLAQQKDIESTAELFPLIYPSDEVVSGYLTTSEYDSLLEKFAEVMANKKETKTDPIQYAEENNHNVDLVKLMAYLQQKDQEFRMSDIERQQIIDLNNIRIIDSLYNIHGKYIGNSLVGDEYKHTMWAVIQHAELEQQEKYLPVIHEAVRNGELPPTPLKMLIDRVYKKKYGYQIFGSQSGGELADDAIIEQVKQAYSL